MELNLRYKCKKSVVYTDSIEIEMELVDDISGNQAILTGKDGGSIKLLLQGNAAVSEFMPGTEVNICLITQQ
jgi:hypothetical protein